MGVEIAFSLAFLRVCAANFNLAFSACPRRLQYQTQRSEMRYITTKQSRYIGLRHTCSSSVRSNWSKSVFVCSRANCKVVVLSIGRVSFPVAEVNTQTLSFARRQQMKIVVTCSQHSSLTRQITSHRNNNLVCIPVITLLSDTESCSIHKQGRI